MVWSYRYSVRRTSPSTLSKMNLEIFLKKKEKKKETWRWVETEQTKYKEQIVVAVLQTQISELSVVSACTCTQRTSADVAKRSWHGVVELSGSHALELSHLAAPTNNPFQIA